jgi:hypothetical protein
LAIAHQTSSFAIEIGINFHGSGEIFMIGFIKKIFAAIFGVLLFPVKLLSSDKNKQANTATDAAPNKKSEAFFLEEADAKGVPAATPKKAKASKKEKVAAAPVAVATASTLNLPQPNVTTTVAENNYVQFTTRRRPGANMKSYLDMAKTIKNA